MTIRKDGGIIASLKSIVSSELTVNVEAQELAFLGEHKPKVEMTWAGGSGNIEVRHKDPSFWTLLNSIQSVAQHRTPGVVFSLDGKFQYPNGTVVSVMIRDLGFDAINVSVPSQKDFATSRIPFKFAQIDKITGGGSLT